MSTTNRKFTFALAGVPVAALLLVLGCSSTSYSPSSDAALSALHVQSGSGDITPAFAQGTLAYTVPTNFAASPGPITVTAALNNPWATLTVRGVPTPDKTPSNPIPLVVGTNTIPIVVTAQDGKTVQTYTITCRIYPPSTTVHALDSSNGVPVPSARITVADATGKVLQSGIPVDANGNTILGLDSVSKYNLSAAGAGTAQSMFAGFDSSLEPVVNFFCHPLGMINFPAQAPQITAMAYSPDGLIWTNLAGNAISDSLANLGALKVTALGSANVAPTAWSGFGMGLNVDQPAWAWSYYGPYNIEEEAVPVVSGASTLYRTTMDIGLPPLNSIAPNTKHYLDLVVYDVANNRTEKKIYVNVTDGAPDTSQSDLSAVAPSSMVVQLVTHGLSRNIFSVTPVDTNAISYEPDIFFSVKAGSTSVAITGYDVLRSTNGTLWTKVATNLFYNPTTLSQYVYTDNDPTLKEGVTYYYKVRAFNSNTTHNGGYSLDSPVIACAFMPPFTVNLAAPASGTVSPSLKPLFTFSITNPALFNPALSDYFYFYLYAREKTMTAASYGQAYRYNFALARFEYRSGSTWLDATGLVSMDAGHANFSIISPTGYFQQGVSYEWSIFGTAGSTSSSSSSACDFRKYFYPYNDPASTSYGVALSKGSTYERGYGAVNGFFTLTIDPNAK